VNGRVEFEGDTTLPNDTEVKIRAFELTEPEEEELWQRKLEVERGEFVTAEELLEEIETRRHMRPEPRKS
jgi:hypothetical protein